MRKLSLSVIACFMQMVFAHAQTDTTDYKARKLHVDEVNFVSSYYTQDGNNSAVTGGVGTEKLTDFANTIELKLLKADAKNRSHNFGIEVGIDHYSSASSDKIDPATLSSASHADTRIYPTLSYSMKDDNKGFIIGGNASYSTEFDYKSYGLGLNVAKQSKDKNTEVGLKLQGYFDTWTLIYPIEARPSPNDYSGKGGNHTMPRNSYSASLTVSQVINQRLQMAFLLDGIFQQGLLATKYQRVYFADNSLHLETLPDTRTKIPIGIRANYFAGDKVILRGYYRFYTDNWGVMAHTASLEMPIKITPFVSVSPFYRYYSQNASDYFAPIKTHTAADVFYTSDFDLSAFNSHFFGTGIRFIPPNGMFGIAKWNMLEIRYGHYMRSNSLHSDIISLNAKFK